MAVLPNLAAAVAAMCDAQRGPRALDGPGGALHLKAGVHLGPAIAVTMNDRIDYFATARDQQLENSPLCVRYLPQTVRSSH